MANALALSGGLYKILRFETNKGRSFWVRHPTHFVAVHKKTGQEVKFNILQTVPQPDLVRVQIGSEFALFGNGRRTGVKLFWVDGTYLELTPRGDRWDCQLIWDRHRFREGQCVMCGLTR